jgi:hypothetical protein
VLQGVRRRRAIHPAEPKSPTSNSKVEKLGLRRMVLVLEIFDSKPQTHSESGSVSRTSSSTHARTRRYCRRVKAERSGMGRRWCLDGPSVTLTPANFVGSRENAMHAKGYGRHGIPRSCAKAAEQYLPRPGRPTRTRRGGIRKSTDAIQRRSTIRKRQ